MHLLLVALCGFTADSGISVVAARSLRQGIEVTLSGPGQDNSPAEEEEAEEALADEEATPPTNVHNLAFISQQRDLETQPPTPSPSSEPEDAPPLSPMPQPILAPPPFAAPPLSPFPAPGLSPMPAPMPALMHAPMPAPMPAPMTASMPAPLPAPMAPATVEMQSPYGPDVPVVQADESTEPPPPPPPPPPAPAPERPTTTTTTKISEKPSTSQQEDDHTVKLSIKFKNIDYNALTADKSLLDDFKETVKEDIAEKIGHGVTPDDIEITIGPGSITVDATVTVQEASAGDFVTLQNETCNSASSLADEMAKDVASIEGISNAASGTVEGEVEGNCAVSTVNPTNTKTNTNTTNPSTAVKSAPVDTDDDDDDDDVDACHPTCVEGQGICSDKMCFCKSPFRGVRCERIRKSASARISYPLAAGIAAFGVFAGVVIGVIFFASFASKKLKQTVTVRSNKAETWQPG